MLNPIRLVNDIFDDKDFSDDKLQAFTDSHLIRFANLNPGSIYSTLITDTSNKYTAYYGKLVSEATKIAVREGLTQARNVARQLMDVKIGNIGDLAMYKFKNNQAVYQQFFPQGVKEYYDANLSEINPLLDRLVTAATAHLTADYPAEVTALTTLVNAFKAAKQAQLNAFSLEVNEQTDRRLARKDLTLQLTTNFLTIAINHLEQPDAYANVYDKQLLPLSSSVDAEGGAVFEEIPVAENTTADAGEVPEDDVVVELTREGGTGNVYICTTNTAGTSCGTSGFELSPGETYTGPFSGMGISGGQFVSITNIGPGDVIIRYRVVG